MDNNYLLEVKTAQTEALKALIEALKEIFKDVIIKFTAKTARNPGGLSIFALNNNGNIFVKLNLPAENFEKFYCTPRGDREVMEIGVNMSNLHKLIKTASKADHITLFVEDGRTNELGIRLDNLQRNCKTTYKLMLLELSNDTNIKIDKQEFDFVITMPSVEFHNTIKNMSAIAEEVDIKFISHSDADGINRCNLMLSCQGDFASQETVFRDHSTATESSVMTVTRNNNALETNIIQGLYELKSLSLFSKCALLCSNIEIYINNNNPLLIKYTVANLGHVFLLLSPIEKATMADDSYSDEED